MASAALAASASFAATITAKLGSSASRGRDPDAASSPSHGAKSRSQLQTLVGELLVDQLAELPGRVVRPRMILPAARRVVAPVALGLHGRLT